MKNLLNIQLLLILTVLSLKNCQINGNEKGFKVPLEIREKNRPKRLTDDVNDRDMIELKKLQDHFFDTIKKSSLHKGFDSFNQVVELLNSDEGVELGRLMVQGGMLISQKSSYGTLLNEFVDDFQYKVSPEFADAVINYVDFAKTMDVSTLPQTMQFLFKKDTLGNSLANLPLGQLVDLVQDEATKYGIDIKGVINGILGKGESKFPELMDSLTKNFNLKSVLKFILPVLEKEGKNIKDNSSPSTQENSMIGHLFKPLIANLLKENDIDLQVDAVVKVLDPFIDQALVSIKQFLPDLMDENGSFKMEALIPLMDVYSHFFSGNKKLSKSSDGMESMLKLAETAKTLYSLGNKAKAKPQPKKEKDPSKHKKPETTKIDKTSETDADGIMNLASQFLGKEGGGMESLINLASKIMDPKKEAGDKGMENILNMASQFLNKDSETGKEMESLMNLASSFLDSNKEPGINSLLKLASQFGGKEGETGADSIMKLVSQLLDTEKGPGLESIMKIAAQVGSEKETCDKKDGSCDKTREEMKKLAEQLLNSDGGLGLKNIMEMASQFTDNDEESTAAKDSAKEKMNNLIELASKFLSTEQEKRRSSNLFTQDNQIPSKKNVNEEINEKLMNKMKEELSTISEIIHVLVDEAETKPVFKKQFIQGIKSFKVQILQSKGKIRNDFKKFMNDYGTAEPFSQLVTHALDNWNEVEASITNEDLRESLIDIVVEKNLDLIQMVVSKKFQETQSSTIHTNANNFFTKNLKPGVTLDNLANHLEPLAMAAKSVIGTEADLVKLLKVLHKFSLHFRKLWTNKAEELAGLNKAELEKVLRHVLEKDFGKPLADLFSLDYASEPACLPRLICDYNKSLGQQRPLRTVVGRIYSLIYGIMKLWMNDESYLIPTLKAVTVIPSQNCQNLFPKQCSQLPKHIEL